MRITFLFVFMALLASATPAAAEEPQRQLECECDDGRPPPTAEGSAVPAQGQRADWCNKECGKPWLNTATGEVSRSYMVVERVRVKWPSDKDKAAVSAPAAADTGSNPWPWILGTLGLVLGVLGIVCLCRRCRDRQPTTTGGKDETEADRRLCQEREAQSARARQRLENAVVAAQLAYNRDGSEENADRLMWAQMALARHDGTFVMPSAAVDIQVNPGHGHVPGAPFLGGPKRFPATPPVEGPKGPAGDKGPHGEKGESGEKGDRGDKGPQGDNGEKGSPGDKGSRGDKGESAAAQTRSTQGAEEEGMVRLRDKDYDALVYKAKDAGLTEDQFYDFLREVFGKVIVGGSVVKLEDKRQAFNKLNAMPKVARSTDTGNGGAAPAAPAPARKPPLVLIPPAGEPEPDKGKGKTPAPAPAEPTAAPQPEEPEAAPVPAAKTPAPADADQGEKK